MIAFAELWIGRLVLVGALVGAALWWWVWVGVDDAIAAHGRERGGTPAPAPALLTADELATLEQLARDAGPGLEVVRGPVLLELVRTYRLFHKGSSRT